MKAAFEADNQHECGLQFVIWGIKFFLTPQVQG